MGNRANVTIKTNHTSTSYYLHWNGGLDTIAPVCRTLFDADVKSTKDFESFLSLGLNLKPERLTDILRPDDLEENGHYIIDLDRKTLHQHTEQHTAAVWHPHLKEAFETYLALRIKPESRDKVRQEYWNEILKLGNEYFKKES